MEEKVVRKTIAKTTTRKVTTLKSATSRIRAVKKTAEPSSVRRAPTRQVTSIETLSPLKKTQKKFNVVLIALPLFLVLLGVSALIGISDKGELDVASAITQRKQNASSDEEKQALESVPTEQIQASAPNGGLVGMGAPEQVEIAPTIINASTTQDGASTSPQSRSGEQEMENVVEPASTTSDTNEPQATKSIDSNTSGA